MGGHLGIKKTQNRIAAVFYWPKMQSDVKKFCRSCDKCQRTVQKGRLPLAPFGKMPIIEQPFKRVTIDIIGPLTPKSENGHKYILTIVDYATKYPEAITLRTITTKSIADALVPVFSRVGLPEEILSDQGRQFTSDLMGEILKLVQIKRLTTTPYHPMYNGLVESFNGVLKQMREFCSLGTRGYFDK